MRQNTPAIEVVQRAENAIARLSEFQHHHPTARPGDTRHLRDRPTRLRHIANAEGDADDVERRVGIRQRHHVRRPEGDVGRLAPRQFQHLGREVGADHSTGRADRAPESDGQIAGAGRAVEDLISLFGIRTTYCSSTPVSVRRVRSPIN